MTDTALEIITDIMLIAGAVEAGQSPDGLDSNDTLRAMNTLIESWSIKKYVTHFKTTDSKTLTVGDPTYTIGSGGDFNTARPTRIEGAYIRDSDNNDHFVAIISSGIYRRLEVKDTEARPDQLWYNPTYSSELGTITLNWEPDVAEDLFIESLKPLTNFTGLTVETVLPPEYNRALKWNTLLEVASGFGYTPTRIDIANAVDSLADIRRLNAEVMREPVSFSPRRPRGSRYADPERERIYV